MTMAARCDEQSSLLSNGRRESSLQPPTRVVALLLLIVVGALLVIGGNNRYTTNNDAPPATRTFQVLRHEDYHDEPLQDLVLQHSARLESSKQYESAPFEPKKRCDWISEKTREKDAGKSEESLKVQYAAQKIDANVYYRATAHVFWNDFVAGNWGNWTMSTLKLPKNTLDPKSLYTWTTGDQHLSNFGAWRNRNNEVVFSVNDFDEAAIYDFHIDVLRIAVSICNHAITNGLSPKKVDKALGIFTDSYIQTVHNYIGNEDALLFELTPDTSFGTLQKFLKKVSSSKSAKKQLQKFTQKNGTTGQRHFMEGGIGIPHKKTSLADVPKDIERKIVNAFSPTQYGATMMKLGWHVRQWDNDYFQVLDVSERIGSGIGSFGIDRYYVLLKGTDGLLGKDGRDGFSVILDIKEQPLAAVERVLSANDAAWYKVMFSNAAARVVEAQRRLTSYVDPFTGWFCLHDDATGIATPFSVRQRSPWKDSINLDDLTKPKDFNDLIAQIGIATATSHVRGTVAKAPAQFKDVIHSIMNHAKENQKKWGIAVAEFAKTYHEQVLLDFECFQEYVDTNFGGTQT